MNEEEKKAVKFFYNLRATIDESNMLFDEEINVKHGKETIKQITTILNLIEKLQKENELAKKQVEYDKTHICTPQIIKLNYIPIQKVKDKISERQFELQQEYKDFEDDAILIVLQELLEGRK